MGRWNGLHNPAEEETDRPAIRGARATINLGASGRNSLLEECILEPHGLLVEEKPLPARATHFRRGIGAAEAVAESTRRPSGPNDDRDFAWVNILILLVGKHRR